MDSASAALQLSVVICTYNRADLLAGVLESLCHQTADPATYEIIVVDNNSTDDTRAVVERFASQASVRYCVETAQGLSHARNRGWREARAGYVGFVDDDCKVPAEWVERAQHVIREKAPGIFGGPYYAFFDAPRPAWYLERYGSNVPWNEPRHLQQGEYLTGGNILFRRSLLEAVGGFDPGFGMTGQQLAYGEETALIRVVRARLPAEVIYYDPQLYVYHLVRPIKTTWRWIIRNNFAHGRYYYRALQLDRMTLIGRLPAAGRMALALAAPVLAMPLLLAVALQATIGGLLRNRRRYPYLQNYLYERALRRPLRWLGALYEQFDQVFGRRMRGG